MRMPLRGVLFVSFADVASAFKYLLIRSGGNKLKVFNRTISPWRYLRSDGLSVV